MESVLDQLAEDTHGKVVVGRVPQSERALFTAFGVKGVPAIFIWYGSKIIQSYVGFHDKAFLANALKEYVNQERVASLRTDEAFRTGQWPGQHSMTGIQAPGGRTDKKDSDEPQEFSGKRGARCVKVLWGDLFLPSPREMSWGVTRKLEISGRPRKARLVRGTRGITFTANMQASFMASSNDTGGFALPEGGDCLLIARWSA